MIKNGPNGEPIVTHGNTLTSKILFKEVIQFLSVFSFEISPYPICISLENHCDHQQQKMLQNHILDYFGKNLFVPLEYHIKNKSFCTLEELKYKILIQTRGDNDFESENFDISPESPTPCSPVQTPRRPKDSPKISKRILDPFLQSIVSLIKAPKMNPSDSPFSIHSVSEWTFGKERIEQKGTIKKYAEDHFIRVYPKATRIQSSNFEPSDKWDVGVQMCALNYQTYDRGMAMNKALFRQNGGVGYVLKPYLSESASPPAGLTLKISLLGSQEIEEMSSKSFVLMFAVCGAPEDEAKNPPKFVEPKSIDRSSMHAIYGKNSIGELDEKEEEVETSETGKTRKKVYTIQHDNVISFQFNRPKTAMIEVSCRQRGSLSKAHIVSTFLPLTAMRSGARVIQLQDSRLGYKHDCLILAKFEFMYKRNK